MEQGKEWEILKREKEGETDSSLLLINEEMMMNFMTCHNMSCTELLARPLANCLKLYLLCNILQTVEKDRTLTWRLTLSMSIEKHCKRSHMGISYTTTTSYQVNSFLFNIDATQVRNCKIPPPPPPQEQSLNGSFIQLLLIKFQICKVGAHGAAPCIKCLRKIWPILCWPAFEIWHLLKRREGLEDSIQGFVNIFLGGLVDTEIN